MTSFGSKGLWKLVLSGCVTLLLLATGCQQSQPDNRAAEETAIRDADTQWSKAAASNNVDGTVSYYADDASLLAPNAPIANGKAAIRGSWTPLLMPGNSLSWLPSKVEVSRSGDLAYVVGSYQLSMKDASGNPISDHGKYVEVWKKQSDGNWKVVADIFNSDLPAKT